MRRFEGWILGFLTLACTSPATAQNDEWKEVARGRQGTVWKLRQTDIQNETNQHPKVWVLLDASRDKTVKFRTSKMYINFDCKARTSQTISTIDYDASGKVIYSRSDIDNPYLHDPIAPGTVIESVLEMACPIG